MFIVNDMPPQIDVSLVDPTRQAMHDARHSDSLSLTEEASRPGALRLTTARSARRFPKGIPDGTFRKHSPEYQSGGSSVSKYTGVSVSAS